ncbi:DNA damage-inducible protein 1 [Smittium mucronatum]|uniref:DNA damage-inducible protein 1 n=1 Tax=Smittium mucronatum TaxID=133383 RepID=A0A1R0GNL1_9FUNG|nr:DNA damage-inducible protein 1 [Smittium mucronatum]
MNRNSDIIKHIDPGIFSGEVTEDAERWIKKFEIYYKNKDNTGLELIEIAEVHFEGHARAWFEVYYVEFTTWEIFKNKFSEKFSDKQKEILAWQELVSTEKTELKILELTAKLNRLFKLAKVSTDREKIKHLLNKIDGRYHVILIKSLEKSWDSVIKRLVDEEETLKTLKESSEKSVNKDKYTLSNKIPIPEPSKDSGMYETLIKRFDQMSINFVELKEDVMKMKQNETFNRASKSYNDITCNFCKRKGHDERYCRAKNESNKTVGMVELGVESCDLLALKRNNSFEDEAEYKKFKEIIVEEPETKSKVRIKRNSRINFMDKEEKYSIKKDLGDRKVSISFAQLLDTSLEARSELLELCKKQKTKEISNISMGSEDITNCKALVKIKGNTVWAIMDTGAACSVVTESFARKNNFEIRKNIKQVIVTADGMRHKTVGVIYGLPITISGYEFPAKVVVLPKAAQEIILGVDWFLQHRATINLEDKELILPMLEYDVVLSLSTKKFENREECELFGVIKVKETSEKNVELSQGIKEVLKEYRELLVSDLEELGCSKIIYHEIDTGGNPPVRK